MRHAFWGIIILIGLVIAASVSAEGMDFSNGLTNATSARPSQWQQSVPTSPAPSSAVLSQSRALPVAASTPVFDGTMTAGYRLGGGDKVRLTVFGEEDLSGEFEVDGTGRLSLPLIGDIQAGGRTLPDVEKLIMATLTEGYLVNPRVNLQVLNFRPFFILGEVNKPGSYPYVNDMTVINAVALAGGYTPRAAVGKVYVKRAGNAADKGETAVPEDARINPGDIIRVDERFF